MNWKETLEKILNYVEEQIQTTRMDIDPKMIASLAGCSYSFFGKLFSYLYRMGFAEYVRARKLTLAGYDLQSSSAKVIDLATRYGYDSPTSFTKAFRQFHGVSPTVARTQKRTLRVVPKLSLKEQTYAWRIERKEAFSVKGVTICLSSNLPFMEQIPAFWEQCRRDGTLARLTTTNMVVPQGIFGFLMETEKETKYSIMVGSESKKSDLTIPALTWFVLDCNGPVPSSIQSGWKYLQQEWLNGYPFRHAPYPELEWYQIKNCGTSSDFSQIWIPIIEEE